MRSRIAWLAGAVAVAGAAAYRALRRTPSPVEDSRAAELRRKLDESRTLVTEREEFEAAETTVDQVEPSADVEGRRREVHERAKAAAEQMRGRSDD
ncbi:MAG: hypothetical protein WBB76_02880 [Gaiellaceae bacterium]